VQANIEDSVFKIRSYYFSYTQPWLLDLIPVSFQLDLWDEHKREFLTSDRQYTTILENNRKGIASIFSIPIIQDRLYFSTKFKKEKIYPTSLSEHIFSTPYSINSISGILSYKSVKNMHNPKMGTYWSIDIERGGNLGFTKLSGLDFTKYNLNYASFWGVSKKATLAFHSFFGYYQPFDQDVVTFETEGYELGGATSLRGYKELNPFLGNREILFNLEYRYDINASLQAVLFWDMGKCFDTGWSFSPSSLHHSQGFGFRLFTPIGPIRFEFAFGEAFIIHFGLGQLF
jgi:outer membrane protein insertion porin family